MKIFMEQRAVTLLKPMKLRGILKSHFCKLQYRTEIKMIYFYKALSAFHSCRLKNNNVCHMLFSPPFPWQRRFSIFSVFSKWEVSFYFCASYTKNITYIFYFNIGPEYLNEEYCD